MTIHEQRYLAANSKSCVSSLSCHMLLCSATVARWQSSFHDTSTKADKLSWVLAAVTTEPLGCVNNLIPWCVAIDWSCHEGVSALIRACACMHVKPGCHAICCWCQSHPKVCVTGHTQALHPADLVRHLCNVINICK